MIKSLILRGHTIITCGDQKSKIIYEKEFPNILHIIIDGYKPTYSKYNKQEWSIVKQIPKFINRIYKEQKDAERISEDQNIDIIISDNRFGFRSKKTINIFLTHQLKIKGPENLMKLANKINQRFIKKFDVCWVPDFENSLLSGDLSSCKFKTTKIGPLSRFEDGYTKKTKFKYKYLAIISGPEPQRSLFEKEITHAFKKIKDPCVIITGEIKKSKDKIKNIDIYPHLEIKKFKEIVVQSELMICRSGYSSIMDLYFLRKKVMFIPTPGQTEQEYLAKLHKKKSKIYFQKQGEINIESTKFMNFNMDNNKWGNLRKNAFKRIGL